MAYCSLILIDQNFFLTDSVSRLVSALLSIVFRPLNRSCGVGSTFRAVWRTVLTAVALVALSRTAAAQPGQTGLSGYMDFHFTKQQAADGQLDFHRFVLLITHQFSDRIRFVSEVELEHAFVEGLERSGEVELEQAYVDFLLSRRFNVRAGMLLAPIGILNERHEPPVYYGVERPLLETVIIPTTWFEAGAGIHGGHVVAEGTVADLIAAPNSITGKYLSGELVVPIPERRPKQRRALKVVNARGNNLKNISAEIPLGLFTCVTGVSGGGKSTFLVDTLYKAIARKLNGASEAPSPHDRIEGLEHLDKVIDIDQSPIGRTPRSNPATYTGA